MAFGLVIMAGLSTTLGSAFVFCSSKADTTVLARALGASAGVMIYVSFAEIYGVKAVESFTEVCNGDSNCGWRYASLCFFSGLIFMYGLDFVVHRINDVGCFWGMKRNSATVQSGGASHDHTLCVHGDLEECKRGIAKAESCLLYTSPSPRDQRGSRMPSSA